MNFDGFKQVDFSTLQTEMIRMRQQTDLMPDINIAAMIKVRSVQTVRKAFRGTAQQVSDEVLSNVLKTIGINSFIVWQNGQRLYYVAEKNLN